MSGLFTQLIQGNIPCHKIHEDDRFFSFLDTRPMKEGHVLVIPKQEIDYIFDLDNELLGDLFKFAKPIAKAMQVAIDCKRVGIMVAGLEVPHAHVHLVPISAVSDLAFANSKNADPKDLVITATKIKQALAGELKK